ncbi:MAG: 6,7-dimethyl-8-ribityllumazine synthase [Gemmatimonadota bacterium]
MGTAGDAVVGDGAGLRVALVVARFNGEVTAELAAGARKALLDAGVEAADIVEHTVPGAFELAPTCRQALAADPQLDAVIALGAVIQGETSHFTFLAQAATQALQALANEVHVPLICGLLTTETLVQAEARADRTRGDKGGESARGALAQVALYARLREARHAAVRGFAPQ